MFLRFVVQRVNDASGVREGLFPTAYALRREEMLSDADNSEISELLDWLDAHMERPDRFNRSTSKGYYRRNTRGIAWLKPGATQHIAKMRALAALLDRNGYTTDVIKSDRPGYVVYEDDVQMIAEPFRDTRA